MSEYQSKATTHHRPNDKKNRTNNSAKNRSQKSIKRNLPKEHQKVALIGFRGVGKSLISQRLAKYWSIPYLSIDSLIAKKAQQPINEIVKLQGWAAFRALETEVLLETTELPAPLLIDTGGGIVENALKEKSQEKIDILKRGFFCIYLYMDDNKLLERLKGSKGKNNRPAISENDSELIEVLNRRKQWYQEVANAVVDVSDVSVSEAAERVAQILRGTGTGTGTGAG